MAGAREIRAGKAYVELSTKDKMTRGLARAQARLRRFGQSCQQLGTTMLGLGAAIAGPVVASLKIFSSLGDAAAKMARRTGLSVQAVQELGFAAKLSGTDVDSLEKGIKRMARNIYDAERGLSTSVDALNDLGLSIKDLQGLKPEDQFTLMADQMSKIEDASRRAALAQVLFGRAGTLLLPMFEKGAAGVAALRKRFRELGIGLTDEEARAAEVFTDAMTDVWTSLKHGVAIVGSALAPSLKDLTATVVKAVREWAAWIRENRRLVAEYARLALKIAAWTVGLGIALIIVGKLAAGVAGLIGVVKALSLASVFLLAHPLVLIFAGAAALIAGLVLGVRHLTHHVAELSDHTARYREEQDKLRAADLERMRRLEQLAKAEKLNATQMDEVAGLIETLEDRYGDLGITLDRITGKLNGVTEAQGRLNDAMSAAAIANLEAELAEHQRNVHELQQGIESFWTRLWHWADGAIDELAEKRAAEFRAIGTLMARIKQLRGGLAGEALTGGGAGAVPGAIGAPGAAELDEKAAADLVRRLRQLQLQTIKDRERRELALMYERYAQEERRLKALGATQAQLDTLRKARELELAAIGNRFAKEREEEGRRAEDKKAAEAKRRINEEARLRWASVDEEARLRDEIARAEIEATKEGIDKRLALLRLEYRQRLEEAAMAGADLALVKRLYDARRRAILAGAETEKVARRFEVRGQFGGLGAERMGGAGAAERMASGIEETAKNTKRLVTEARTGGLVFG